MQYSNIAKVRAVARPRSARGPAHGLCCAGAEPAAPDVTVPDPSAFGLYPHRPANQVPAAYFQTPQMLAFAARVDELLTRAGRFKAGCPIRIS